MSQPHLHRSVRLGAVIKGGAGVQLRKQDQ